MPDPDYGANSWHRADYILRGEYCPLERIRSHLDDIRVALAARLLIHVAHDHELIIRSLSWAVGKDWDADAISTRLGRADYRNENQHVNRLLFDAIHPESLEPWVKLDEETASHLANQLLRVKYRKSNDLGALQPQAPNVAWSGLLLNHTGRPGLKLEDGEVRSVVLVHPPLAVGASRYPKRELRDLGVMLKCTAEANARRDQIVMRKVASELTTIDLGSETAFEEMARQALLLACDVTGSSGGAIYLSTTSDDLRFRQVASCGGASFHYPEDIPFDPNNNTISWSVSKHTPYQQLGSSLAVRGLTRAVVAAGGTELVTPIAGPTGNTWAPAIGAIILFHEHGDPRGYGAYDRALVRNVSLRIALARANVATREIADAISTLRSRSPQRLQIKRDHELDDPPTTWPKDIGLAVVRFQRPLQRLAEATQSHSVTLRIALPRHNDPDPYGFGLVRVAAYPTERMSDPFEVLRDGDPGLHWDVMRSGQERYASRIREKDPYFPAVRPRTRSALCVPVKVEGILAGTLNLESPFDDNYAPFLPLVLALSGAVGRTLADARAELEDDILNWAAQALDRRHASSRELIRIQRNLHGLAPSSQRTELLAELDGMQSLVKNMRSTSELRPEPQPASIWEVLATTIKRLELQIHGFQPPEAPLFHEPLDTRACVCLKTMFQSVLYNLNKHSSPDAYDSMKRAVPRVHFGVLRLQAVDQAAVIIENYSSKYLTQRLCSELYRYPIEGQESELRLGTYIAGINARRIGARIYASLLEDSRTLRTTMIVPVPQLAAGKG